MFSSRCASEVVPGIGRMLGDRATSQASATCGTVAPCRFATAARCSAVSGWNPPTGKNGTYDDPTR
jgi:hypothetical protein